MTSLVPPVTNNFLHPRLLWSQKFLNDCCTLPQLSDAKDKKLNGFKQRNMYDVVSSKEAHLECQKRNEASKIRSLWDPSIKNVETPNPIYKTSNTAQGHTDREKRTLVHDSRSLKIQTIKLITAIVVIFIFRLWSCDVTLASLQKRDKSTVVFCFEIQHNFSSRKLSRHVSIAHCAVRPSQVTTGNTLTHGVLSRT